MVKTEPHPERPPQYLFLPIDPGWAIAILNGAKKWELRSKRPAIKEHDVVVLYATSPLRAVVGSFVAGTIISGTPRKIWNAVGGETASTRNSYLKAFGHLSKVHAIKVKQPRRLDPFTPAFPVGQGWRYLDGRNDPAHRAIIKRVKDSR